MPEAVGVPGRMRQARLQTAANRRAAVSQEEMAALVSKALGRVIRQTQWGRYETGASEPPLDVIQATAAVSGLEKGYIAFGVDPSDIDLEPDAATRHRPVREIDPSIVKPALRSTRKKDAG